MDNPTPVANTPPVPEAPASPKSRRIPIHYLVIGGIVAAVLISGISFAVLSQRKVPVTVQPTSTPSPSVTPSPSPTVTPVPITPKSITPAITGTSAPTPTLSVVPTTGFMGFNFTTTHVTLNIGKGECVYALSFTSTGSTSWHFNQLSFHPDVYWEKTDGSASNGETIEQKVCAKSDARIGNGLQGGGGQATFYDKTTNASHDIIVNVKYK